MAKAVKTTLTMASVAIKQALDAEDPMQKSFLMNEGMALSLISMAESLNRMATKAGAAASSESDSG